MDLVSRRSSLGIIRFHVGGQNIREAKQRQCRPSLGNFPNQGANQRDSQSHRGSSRGATPQQPRSRLGLNCVRPPQQRRNQQGLVPLPHIAGQGAGPKGGAVRLPPGRAGKCPKAWQAKRLPTRCWGVRDRVNHCGGARTTPASVGRSPFFHPYHFVFDSGFPRLYLAIVRNGWG